MKIYSNNLYTFCTPDYHCIRPIPTDESYLIIHEKKIASGELDGESDIFSVNITGGLIRFVITKQSEMLIVRPLEKTDVTVECIYDSFYYTIKGFKITGGSTTNWVRTVNCNKS